jgi:hypothetical protein
MNFQAVLEDRLAKVRFGVEFGADPSYPAKVTVATVATGDLGRLYLRSQPVAGTTANIIGSAAKDATVTATGPSVNNFTPVDVTGIPNASHASEPGGSSDGSWLAGTSGFMASAYLKILQPDGTPALLSNTLPPGADTGGSPPPTLQNTGNTPVVHPATGDVVAPPAMIRNKQIMAVLLGVGAATVAVAGAYEAYKHFSKRG